MATSQKQLDANRRNAQKSTGPRTAEGKQRSSRNAYRHGLTGQVSVNSEEDRAAHQSFTAEIMASLKPQGAVETQLALSVAEQYWRLNLARAMEDNMFALGHYGPAADMDVDHPEIHAALTSARVFLQNSKAFERLTLYEQRIHRTLQKDSATLEAMQAARTKEREAALEEAAKIARVAEHDGEQRERKIEVNGLVFSIDEITRRIARNINLERFESHEKNHWTRTRAA